MQCKEKGRQRPGNHGFCDIWEYIEKLREMIQDGTINVYKAVQMLDRKMDNIGRFKEYYEENRIKIINNLFL